MGKRFTKRELKAIAEALGARVAAGSETDITDDDMAEEGWSREDYETALDKIEARLAVPSQDHRHGEEG